MYTKTQRPSFKYSQNKTIFLVYIKIITLGSFTLIPCLISALFVLIACPPASFPVL